MHADPNRPDSTTPQDDAPRIGVIACAVLEDEIRHFAATQANVRQIELLEQGLHNDPPRLRAQLQVAVDRIEEDARIDAIILGYGLCSRGTEGVRTTRCRMVIPRAHDCITLLLGSKERYASYVAKHPGTYWYSPGWNRCHIPPGRQRYEKRRAEYVEKYGEDNADYLMEMEQHWFTSYDRATYVELGVGVTDQDLQYSRDCADWLNWSFEHLRGDPALVRDMLAGRWDDDRFLVIEPGMSFAVTADDRIIAPARMTDTDATSDA